MSTIKQGHCARRRIKKAGRVGLLELLENRTLFTLLGIPTDLPSTLGLNTSSGSLEYSSSTDELTSTATPVTFTLNSTESVHVGAPREFDLNVQIDNNGNLIGPGTPTDLSISGTVDLTAFGGQMYTGTLLTGQTTQFGFDV